MNVAVLDHIAEGHRSLAAADRIEAEGTALALREAEAIREAQAMSSATLMGDIRRVRSRACSVCGCYTLLPRRGVAYCINAHCNPGGPQRRWHLRDLALTRPARPIGIRKSTGRPRDLVTRQQLVTFFAAVEDRSVSATTVHRLATTYDLPTWPGPNGSLLYALSDVATAHAAHTVRLDPAECQRRTDAKTAACSGLGHLVFREKSMTADEVKAVKDLCAVCPIRALCLETALEHPAFQRDGVYGGLSAVERRRLLKSRRAAAGEEVRR